MSCTHTSSTLEKRGKRGRKKFRQTTHTPFSWNMIYSALPSHPNVGVPTQHIFTCSYHDSWHKWYRIKGKEGILLRKSEEKKRRSDISIWIEKEQVVVYSCLLHWQPHKYICVRLLFSSSRQQLVSHNTLVMPGSERILWKDSFSFHV